MTHTVNENKTVKILYLHDWLELSDSELILFQQWPMALSCTVNVLPLVICVRPALVKCFYFIFCLFFTRHTYDGSPLEYVIMYVI